MRSSCSRLSRCPGRGRRSAQDAIAETGADMTRFASGSHLASWAGRTPLDHQSGKRNGQARHKKGNTLPRRRHSARPPSAAGKTQTREGARYRKLARSRGKNKACVAVGNTQLKVYHKLLSNPGMRYQDLGPDYYEHQAATRRKISLPRPRDRSPRLRSHPLPQPRARARRHGERPGRRLTHPDRPCPPCPRSDVHSPPPGPLPRAQPNTFYFRVTKIGGRRRSGEDHPRPVRRPRLRLHRRRARPSPSSPPSATHSPETPGYRPSP